MKEVLNKVNKIVNSEKFKETVIGFSIGFTFSALPMLLIGRILGYEFKK